MPWFNSIPVLCREIPNRQEIEVALDNKFKREDTDQLAIFQISRLDDEYHLSTLEVESNRQEKSY
jgi:hypothetical protein